MDREVAVIDSRGKDRYQTVNEMPSETITSDTDKADIQQILRKYREIGLVDHIKYTEAAYLDVSEHEDFTEVMRTAKRVEMEFLKLPPGIRDVFGNDPAEWLDYAHDKDEVISEKLMEMGAIPRPEVVADTPPPENSGSDSEE